MSARAKSSHNTRLCLSLPKGKPKMAPGQVFLPVFQFPPVSIIPPTLHTHLHPHVFLTERQVDEISELSKKPEFFRKHWLEGTFTFHLTLHKLRTLSLPQRTRSKCIFYFLVSGITSRPYAHFIRLNTRSPTLPMILLSVAKVTALRYWRQCQCHHTNTSHFHVVITECSKLRSSWYVSLQRQNVHTKFNQNRSCCFSLEAWGHAEGRVYPHNGFPSFTWATRLLEERAVWLDTCNYRSLRVYKAAECISEENVLHFMEVIVRRPNANGTFN